MRCGLLVLWPLAEAFQSWDVEVFDQEGCDDDLSNCSSHHCRYPAAELCARSCGLCGRARRASPCQVATCRPFCGHVDWLRFLSRAAERYGGRLVSERPALAEFPDFFTKQELEAIKEVAFDSGFQSEDELPREVRDVKKVDCETQRCLLDPIVQEVYHRVSTLLDVPPENFESMEFLLYDRGQHYAAHMDDEDDLRDAPPVTLSAGLRVLTVFFYLSEVVGGETRFPNRDLEVKPKAGTAVVWANVQSDIWRVDQDALHQAMPVRKGRKLAANFWVHPFEYRAAEKYCKQAKRGADTVSVCGRTSSCTGSRRRSSTPSRTGASWCWPQVWRASWAAWAAWRWPRSGAGRAEALQKAALSKGLASTGAGR